LRDRAVEFGAISINGLVTDVVLPEGNSATAPYTIKYSNYDGKKTGTPETLEVDMIVGADGANSRVAKAIDAGEYNYAIAFQERIRIDDEKMAFYENLAGTQFICFKRTKPEILTHLWGSQRCTLATTCRLTFTVGFSPSTTTWASALAPSSTGLPSRSTRTPRASAPARRSRAARSSR
jgi:2-polyprenyl-6-methoxyphenol hydroxylase-like FAD-dependent oxidoreductase